MFRSEFELPSLEVSQLQTCQTSERLLCTLSPVPYVHLFSEGDSYSVH